MTMRLSLDHLASPLGPLLLVTDEAGRLRALDFDAYAARMHRLLARHYGDAPGAYELTPGAAPAAVRDGLTAYFGGHLPALADVPVATGGTPFQRSVWAALRTVPPGATTSYGALAARVGAPQAARAVGLANGANPIAIVVPCHRVIGAGGALTGYAGGVERKRWLLEHEHRAALDGAVPFEGAPRVGTPSPPTTPHRPSSVPRSTSATHQRTA